MMFLLQHSPKKMEPSNHGPNETVNQNKPFLILGGFLRYFVTRWQLTNTPPKSTSVPEIWKEMPVLSCFVFYSGHQQRSSFYDSLKHLFAFPNNWIIKF
jgi:hypothetical protein